MGGVGPVDGRAACPCGTGVPYGRCCGPLHAGAARAGTAEALMRSRYSAFVVGDEAHLLRTWHPRTRPASLGLDATLTWTGLEVVEVEGGGPDDEAGVVAFRASLVGPDGPDVLAERSRFERRGGRWVYVDGDVVA